MHARMAGRAKRTPAKMPGMIDRMRVTRAPMPARMRVKIPARDAEMLVTTPRTAGATGAKTREKVAAAPAIDPGFAAYPGAPLEKLRDRAEPFDGFVGKQ